MADLSILSALPAWTGPAALGLSAALALGILAWLGLAWYFTLQLVRPPLPTLAETRRATEDDDGVSPALIDRFTETVSIPTGNGYSLAGVVLGGDGAARTLVMQHGISWTWHGNLKYAAPFLDRSWNIVMFNSRGHAGNPPAPPGFGWYEKDDLADVAAWARRRFPATRVLGFFGESMGAATVLMALGNGLAADFAICDCAYSDLEALSAKELRRSHVPGFAVRPVLWLARRLVRRLAGFDLRAIKPARDLSGSRVPLLIMHGARDGLAPVAMAAEIRDAAGRNAPVRLEVFPDARHAKSWASDPARYEKAVHEFLAEHARV